MPKRVARVFLWTVLMTLPPAFCAAPESQQTPPAEPKKQPAAPGQTSAATAPPAAAENDRKYADVLYPAGLPSRENYDTGRSETARYALLAEAPLPSGRTVVLHSESVGDANKDHTVLAFLSVLVMDDGKAR